MDLSSNGKQLKKYLTLSISSQIFRFLAACTHLRGLNGASTHEAVSQLQTDSGYAFLLESFLSLTGLIGVPVTKYK